MSDIEISDWYETDGPMVYTMIRNDGAAIWSLSVDELKRMYIRDPEEWLTGPLPLKMSQGEYNKVHKLFIDLSEHI